MNITSKRLDKIKKTKNQSKRRIHYKNKKKNGKEKNRRKKRKYNKSTGKYRKTHKQKKRAYDLKNKSLKFKKTQPGNKSDPLKIITTDKPLETVQTGGDGDDLWKKFKELFKRANDEKQAATKEETETITYSPLTKRIVVFNPAATDPDTAVTLPYTPDPTAVGVVGDLTKHVETAKAVVDGNTQQAGGEQEIYNMMLEYNTDKTATRWNDGNWVKLGKKLAGLIDTDADKTQFVNDLGGGREGEAKLVADAMQKVLENIDGENEMRVGHAYANKDGLNKAMETAMNMAMANEDIGKFHLKAIIRGTNKFKCGKHPAKQKDGTRSVGHYDSFVRIEGENKYVHFDAVKVGTKMKSEDKTTPETVDIKNYLPQDLSCNYLIFLFNNDEEYPTTENLKDLKVTTKDNGKNRCWINATLYAVLFGIMNKKGKETSGEEEEEEGEEEEEEEEEEEGEEGEGLN